MSLGKFVQSFTSKTDGFTCDLYQNDILSDMDRMLGAKPVSVCAKGSKEKLFGGQTFDSLDEAILAIENSASKTEPQSPFIFYVIDGIKIPKSQVAYFSGQTCKEKRFHPTDNPYPTNTKEFNEWLQGYLEG